jgi:RNA polymerase sigma-70 factor, ECF subfamily
MGSVEAKFRTGADAGAAANSHGLTSLPYAADDTVLIRQAQTGRWEAFAEVASHYDRSILALALRLTGSEREARDLFQQAFLETYRELRHYRFQCSFYLWIYRIVARTCMEFLRSRGAIHVGHATQLQAALEQLSPRERIVLELKQYFGLKLDTIAAILGIDETSTRNILVRATLALRLELEAQSVQQLR